MDKLFINYSGNIESFKRLGLEETYKKRIVFIEKDGAIYTHNAYYAGPDVIKSIQEALSELQEEVKEGDYVASIRQVDGKIETTMGTFEERDSKILEDSKSYTDELKKAVTTAIATEYMRATGAERNLSERIDSHLDITERALSEKADKDSVYDKDQIDQKLTGVYKIKGSCTFEKLPKTNKVGDVYNITNSFTLDEEEYTAGTNVVYTENGWDVLAGIFDTSSIESDIQRVSNLLAQEVVRAIKAENDLEDKINEEVIRAQEKELELDKKFDNYLPLTGGTLYKSEDNPIVTFKNNYSPAYINFKSNYANGDGSLGIISKQLKYIGSDSQAWNTVLHEGNYSNYALPLTGGSVTGNTVFNSTTDTPLIVKQSNGNSATVGFKSANTVDYSYIGFIKGSEWFVTDDGWHNAYKIYHEGNFNPSDYLPLSGGKLIGNLQIGESDSAKDNKLYVDGTIKSTDKIFINDDEVITEAPSDTTMYARSNKSWVPISGYEDIVSYGVKWEKNATSPICTRIGNPLLHKELPIQSQFRGCIYDYKTGVFKYWLNPNDWSLKEDGTASVLDGTDGDVCVHTPKFYGKSGEDNGYYWVRISLTKIDDSWIEIPEMYIGAYRSTVDRTNSLARSIVNTSAQYRGGINSADYDQYLETDPFRTLLGKPATNISRANMRTYCRNNNSEMLSYEQYKWIFYWAYVIEYANFNAQAGYNEELTTEGYRQGGLGNGMTTWGGSNWDQYNYYNPITPCGYGNNIGNFTGIKTVTVPAYTGRDGATSVTEKSYQMPRWRGFDNPFGDIQTNLDGVIIQGQVDLDGNPSYKEVYTTTNPTKYGDTLENMLDMNIAGIEIYKAGYTLEFDLRETAEIIPSAVGASITTGKCDYHYVQDSSTNYTNLRTLLVGGCASDGGFAGSGFFDSNYGVGRAWHYFGFRMVKEIKD